MFLPEKILERRLLRFLEDDLGEGDITSHLLILEEKRIICDVVVKEDGMIAGLDVASALCESLTLRADAFASNGDQVKAGTPILRIVGDAKTILSAERIIVNILSRMSGIATQTFKLIQKVRAAGYSTRISCTRKTAPGFSHFDKKAVSIGGGDTHRLHLDDLILIKDNHVRVIGSVKKAVTKARRLASFTKKVEIEVSSIDEALQAAEAGADIIMLDNFSPDIIKKTISKLTQRNMREAVLLEASGGITSENILEYVAVGVDILSLGEITHSPRALDISLEVVNDHG